MHDVDRERNRGLTDRVAVVRSHQSEGIGARLEDGGHTQLPGQQIQVKKVGGSPSPRGIFFDEVSDVAEQVSVLGSHTGDHVTRFDDVGQVFDCVRVLGVRPDRRVIVLVLYVDDNVGRRVLLRGAFVVHEDFKDVLAHLLPVQRPPHEQFPVSEEPEGLIRNDAIIRRAHVLQTEADVAVGTSVGIFGLQLVQPALPRILLHLKERRQSSHLAAQIQA